MRYPQIVLALLVLFLITSSASAQQILCQPCQYNFGQVTVGNSVTYSFEIVNIGSKLLRVLSVSKQGTDFALASLSLPANILPGRAMLLPVTFTPLDSGFASGELIIVSNDPNSPLTIKFDATGEPAKPGRLTINPATLNFGNVTVGSAASLSVSLTASGGNVVVSAEQTNSSEFSITGLTLPVAIAAGKSVQVTINFSPKAPGTAEAKAGFFSNAQNSLLVEQLTGTAVAQPPLQVDLTWEPDGSSVIGYNVYRGNTHGGPYSQLNTVLLASTSYTDYEVVAGKTYYYVATEVNSQGQQSSYSKEVQATVPKN